MFRDELKRLRKKKKVNQYDIAEAVNMSQPTVASWENGTRKPDIDTVMKLAHFFGTTTDDLLGYEREDDNTQLSEVEYALNEEIRDLTENEGLDILDYIRFKKSQRKPD